jgi:hypothetical protein
VSPGGTTRRRRSSGVGACVFTSAGLVPQCASSSTRATRTTPQTPTKPDTNTNTDICVRKLVVRHNSSMPSEGRARRGRMHEKRERAMEGNHPQRAGDLGLLHGLPLCGTSLWECTCLSATRAKVLIAHFALCLADSFEVLFLSWTSDRQSYQSL